jgi:hypothetical protein
MASLSDIKGRLEELPQDFIIREKSGPNRRQVVFSVVELLKSTRLPIAADVINRKLLLDVHESSLFKDLCSNPKLSYAPQQRTFQFKPTHAGLSKAEDVVRLLAHFPLGMRLEELLDAYIGVEKDLQALVDDDRIIAVRTEAAKETQKYKKELEKQLIADITSTNTNTNTNTSTNNTNTNTNTNSNSSSSSSSSSSTSATIVIGEDVVGQYTDRYGADRPLLTVEPGKFLIYPRQLVDDMEWAVSSDIRTLWEEVKMPNSLLALEKELHQTGHLTADEVRDSHMDKVMRGQMAAKRTKKPKGKSNRFRSKLTNAHLVNELSWLKPGANPPKP